MPSRRQSHITLALAGPCAALAVACSHAWPFDAGHPAPLGPRGQESRAANVADLPVAITAASDSSVVWFVPGDSVPHSLIVGSGVGPVTDIAPLPGTRRFIAVVERGRDLFGDPASLWLYDLP